MQHCHFCCQKDLIMLAIPFALMWYFLCLQTEGYNCFHFAWGCTQWDLLKALPRKTSPWLHTDLGWVGMFSCNFNIKPSGFLQQSCALLQNPPFFSFYFLMKIQYKDMTLGPVAFDNSPGYKNVYAQWQGILRLGVFLFGFSQETDDFGGYSGQI